MSIVNTSPRYSRSEAKAYARNNLRGVWGAIPYPFTAADELDEQGMRRNIRYCIDNKLLDGIYCGHFMSEFWSLTTEERKRAAEIVVDECRGSIPVMVHTGHTSVKESVELSQHAERSGADYLAVGNPYFMAYDDAQIYDYFHSISERTEAGILITNTGYTGIVLSPEMINRLADLENVVAVKNSPKLPHTLETLRLVSDRIIVSSPDESIWFTLMTEHNCRLYMSSAAPYLLQKPGQTPLQDYTALVFQGQIDEAAIIAQNFEPARKVFNKWLRDPWPTRRLMPIAYLKTWSDLLGMVGGPVRSPLLQTTPAERAELRQDLASIRLL
ncbi:MAG TPA: dihydrodipicolinate synthase family protein [Ktedonobacteraceae bacterium]|nr:dihydrodipicolinate synthase family protein [Ktedonobacteraceae bacterium]